MSTPTFTTDISYNGIIRGDRMDVKEQLKFIIDCSKLLNKQIDISEFIRDTPFHSDVLFKFDDKYNYQIDIGHYLFRTIRMLNKIKDTIIATNDAIKYINDAIISSKNTPIYIALIDNIYDYATDNTKKEIYINHLCNIIDKLDNINNKIECLIFSIFSINIINHYTKQYGR